TLFRSARRAPGAAGTLAGELVAPIGTNAIEIGFEKARALLVLGPAFTQQRQQVGAAELFDPHAAEPALQDGAGHAAGVVIERHAQERRRHSRSLTGGRSAVAVEKGAKVNQRRSEEH